MKVCDKTRIFFFFPIINNYFLMAKRSLRSRCPSYLQRNIGARSCNHCRGGKAISITYSECVSVALGFQHAACESSFSASFITITNEVPERRTWHPSRKSSQKYPHMIPIHETLLGTATTKNTPTLRNSQVTFDTLRTTAVNHNNSYSCKVLLQHVSA